MAAAAPHLMGRKRDFSSKVWDEKNKLMLLLSPVSEDGDKALCWNCNVELTAGSSRSGTKHLARHPATANCKRNAAARRAAGDQEMLLGLGWTVGDAVALLQARSPATVEAVQWRQGPDTMLLLRERPQNMAELQQQGCRVLLLPELEQRVQANMQDLQGLLLQEQPPTPQRSHIVGWLPGLTEDDMRFLQEYDSSHSKGTDSPAQPYELMNDATGYFFEEDSPSMMELADDPHSALRARVHSAAGNYQGFSSLLFQDPLVRSGSMALLQSLSM